MVHWCTVQQTIFKCIGCMFYGCKDSSGSCPLSFSFSSFNTNPVQLCLLSFRKPDCCTSLRLSMNTPSATNTPSCARELTSTRQSSQSVKRWRRETGRRQRVSCIACLARWNRPKLPGKEGEVLHSVCGSVWLIFTSMCVQLLFTLCVCVCVCVCMHVQAKWNKVTGEREGLCVCVRCG